MLHRFSLKIGGASGTGINTVGKILSRAFKRSKYYNFAYREYPSLIKGGFSSYQIDVSDKPVNSASKSVDISIAIDKNSFKVMSKEIAENKCFVYDKSSIRVSDESLEELKSKGIKVYDLPLSKLAKDIGGNTIMKNTVLQGAIWKLLGLDVDILVKSVLDVFNKSPEIEEANKKCVLAGFDLVETDDAIVKNRFSPTDELEDHMSITGNEAIALGAAAAGVRAYYAYPMTPSTSILSTMAKIAKSTGILVKQAEDEITAANLTIGSMFAGTRAMTATSGGGFDLMSETVSLSAITETPFVLALAQRPGPGTGMPTWSSQGDLKIAINAGHGEFPRVVLSPGDTEECFYLTAEAFNIAEKYQIPVIILTDKYLAESLYTASMYDQSKINVNRGNLLNEVDDSELERYAFSEDGVSQRWNPGVDANTYLANSDEHDEYGHSIEDAEQVKEMLDKRLSKQKNILDSLPEPKIYGEEDCVVSFIGWGSTKHTVLDSINELKEQGISVNYLHYSYVYPLKTKLLNEFIEKSKNLVLIENNQTGQLGELIKSKVDVTFADKMFKYDGRPFWVEEIVEKVKSLIN